MDEIVKTLRQFIVENFLFGQDDGTLQSETSFMDSSIVDSTGVLELVGYLEEQYGIEVQDDELIPENLDSLQNLARYVQSKSAAAD